MLRKIAASLFVAFFALVIMALPASMRQHPAPAGDIAGGIAVPLLFFLLALYGLRRSVQWLIKLNGHTYELHKQAWACILYWYSMLGVIVGLLMAFTYHLQGVVMMMIWVLAGVACWRWRGRLRSKEAVVRPSELGV